MVDLSETVWQRTRRDWWRHAESPQGRIVELATTVALSVWAVSLYPSDALAAEQAWIQGRTIAGGLVVLGVFWVSVVFVALAPRALNKDARRALRQYAVDTPRLEITDAYPSYHRTVDGSPSTIWCIRVSNVTATTIATNVELSIVSVGHLVDSVFPVKLHEAAREDYQKPPPQETRNIRYGDTARYEIVSEPYNDTSDSPAKLEWHSSEFQTGLEGELSNGGVAVLQAHLERDRYVDILLRAVADPPCLVVEQRFRLRRLGPFNAGALGIFNLETIR